MTRPAKWDKQSTVLFPEMMHHLGQVATTVEGQLLPQHKTLPSEKLFMAPLWYYSDACEAGIFCNLSDTPQEQEMARRSSMEALTTGNWRMRQWCLQLGQNSELCPLQNVHFKSIPIVILLNLWGLWPMTCTNWYPALKWTWKGQNSKFCPWCPGLLQWLNVKNLTANGNKKHCTNRPTYRYQTN